MDSTVTSSDFYTVFDNIVATNPQLNQSIKDARNEAKLFLVRVLRFYSYHDMVYVEELGTKKKYYCHVTHEMVSYEVAFNCMCDGSVESDNVYGTYVKPFNPIYGVVADVRFKGTTDEKCLLSCLNYGNNKELKSNVRNGEVKLVSGESSVSLTRNRVSIVTPRLFVNGLPYDEPKLENYFDKSQIGTIKSNTDAQLDELNKKIEGLDIDSIRDVLSDFESRIDDIEQGEVDLDNLDVGFTYSLINSLDNYSGRIAIHTFLKKK